MIISYTIPIAYNTDLYTYTRSYRVGLCMSYDDIIYYTNMITSIGIPIVVLCISYTNMGLCISYDMII